MMTTLRMSIMSGFLDCEFWKWFQGRFCWPVRTFRLKAFNRKDRQVGPRSALRRFHFLFATGLPAVDFPVPVAAGLAGGGEAAAPRASSSGTMRRALSKLR